MKLKMMLVAVGLMAGAAGFAAAQESFGGSVAPFLQNTSAIGPSSKALVQKAGGPSAKASSHKADWGFETDSDGDTSAVWQSAAIKKAGKAKSAANHRHPKKASVKRADWDEELNLDTDSIEEVWH